MDKRNLVKAAKAHGATVEWECANRFLDVNVDAPRGKLWKASWTHTIGGATRTYDQKWVSDFVASLVKEVNEGTQDCNDPDCEICRECERCGDDTGNRAIRICETCSVAGTA